MKNRVSLKYFVADCRYIPISLNSNKNLQSKTLFLEFKRVYTLY